MEKVERPVTSIPNPPKGTVTETVFLFAKKHGYDCTIKGEICGGTVKSRSKAKRKWEISAMNWFIGTPIDRVLLEPFVICEINETDMKRIKQSPIFKAFDNSRLEDEYQQLKENR
jgi:hypothetical protein